MKFLRRAAQAPLFLAATLHFASTAHASRMSILDASHGAAAMHQAAQQHMPAKALPTARPAAAQPAVSAPNPSLPLRVINSGEFCTRLRNVFAVYANQNGYDTVQTALLASVATSALVDEFRVGRASDYISAPALSALAKLEHRGPTDRFLPVAEIVGNAMGLNGTVALALSAGELRFLPFTQRGIDVVVIARNTAALSPERARKVAEVARGLNVRISVLWAGGDEEQPGALHEARSLAWLASQTGGGFVNMSGQDQPCTTLL